MVPTGAVNEKISSATCNPIRIRRTRRNPDGAEDDPNIDIAPLPGSTKHPSTNRSALGEWRNAIG